MVVMSRLLGCSSKTRGLSSSHWFIRPNSTHHYSTGKNIAYLGLGSNLGDRLKNISDAIRALSLRHPPSRLLDTSFVYQSQPMYVTDQPEFLNAACKISTPLSPQELLTLIKSIESDQGRILDDNAPRNGPRPIDIDILFYNSEIVRQENLRIPHLGITEREFVLEPLIDMARQMIHPETQTSIESLLADLRRSNKGMSGGVRRRHLISGRGCGTLDLSSRTHLMSIVNCTPDSFSDGGVSLRLEDGVRESLSHVADGADILDIGGMSTRPGASEVLVETEIQRTVPLIRELRERYRLECHISIDTCRAETAEMAVRAGATMINDVSGGEADSKMLETVAGLGVPYVLMHMRGNPRTMDGMAVYDKGEVVESVRRELGVKFRKALEAGIYRWNVLIDPGFGFAKDLSSNCRLLNSLDSLLSSDELVHLPLLVGLSRKRFLAQLLNLQRPPPPDQRLVATIVASTLAILRGAQLIRAHDTQAIKQLITTLDGIRSFS